jgi:hypothetical protein
MEVPGSARKQVEPIVREIAMRSLLPVSSSRRCLRSLHRLILLDLRRAKTAATSIEETMVPKRRSSVMEKPKTIVSNQSMLMAVMATPAVARMTPFYRAGWILFPSVSRPPEKRRKARVATPRS